MVRLLAISFLTALGSLTLAQQGGIQGPVMGDGMAQSMNRMLGQYLNGEEIRSILTAGAPLEWKLELKAGQVVIAESRSDAFDPAMEIVDKANVLAKNDDRYPGDQRPLLFWRCEQDGTYLLRVRSYQDKAGGQAFVRFKTYQSIDLSSGGFVEKDINPNQPFLARIPMKAGQLIDVVSDTSGGFLSHFYNLVIAPNGLPDISLSKSLSGAVNAIMAPVTGDYYVMYTINSGRNSPIGKVKMQAREVVPGKLAKDANGLSASAATNTPSLWELDVKKGDFLEASASDLSLNCRFVLAEVPDVSKYDLADPEKNPFFPQPRDTNDPEQPFDVLPGRARDGRVTVFHVNRDAKLWIATNGAGPDKKQFSVRVKPAAVPFTADSRNVGKLRVGRTDYWTFDAVAGDVMTFNSKAEGFAQQILVRDPELHPIHSAVADPDQTSDEWRLIAQKPGRYTVAVSCLGDGGAGDYALSRKVYEARTFSKSVPAKSTIGPGEVQIWKFTAQPNDPLLVQWYSENWSYGVAIYNEAGQSANFQRQPIDSNNHLGILKVDQPRTFLIVLTGGSQRSAYEIQLNDIPARTATHTKSTKGD